VTQLAEQPKSPDRWREIRHESLGLTIYASLNTSKEKIFDNIRTNIASGYPQVWPHTENKLKVALVAGGPSLEETLPDLKKAVSKGYRVVALANVARELVKHGIPIHSHILLDAMPNNASFITDTDCTYLVASQCDPSVIKTIGDKGYRKIHLWHAVNDEEDFKFIGELMGEWVPVQGGSTITLRALRLLHILGYHKFEVFGFDSCIYKGKHHAYDQPNADNFDIHTIGLNGRKFDVHPWMIQQAMDFIKMVKIFGQKWEIIVHGDGLIANMIKEASNG